MAEFTVEAVRIDEVTDHPDADRLSLNRIGGYIAVSNKNDGEHRYKAGDLVVYVPEGAVVPIDVLDRYGYTNDKGEGILAGSKGNRVKAIRLRGVLSQGLILPLDNISGTLCLPDFSEDRFFGPMGVVEGQDVASWLNITKYEPPIPSSMSGDLIGSTHAVKFDVENGQKYPDVFSATDMVYVTEKLHGTFAAFVFMREEQEGWFKIHDGLYATAHSKGLGAKGLVFNDTEKNRKSNIYVRSLLEFINDGDVVEWLDERFDTGLHRVAVLGEIYGKGVQDLTYSTEKPEFAAFDLILDYDYVSHDQFTVAVYANYLLPGVPLLWTGPYGALAEQIEVLRDGKSAVDNSTLREGIVVRGGDETSRDQKIGRKMVKYVSPDYLTRKGGTELN